MATAGEGSCNSAEWYLPLDDGAYPGAHKGTT
jgi:hypothetical protein